MSDLISHITKTSTNLNQTTAIFGMQLDSFPKQSLTIVSHILIAARMAITTKWKQTKAPNVADVIHRVNTNYICEKYIAGQNNSIHSFDKKWMPWTQEYNLTYF